jgi:hypothetical protein
MTTVDISSDAAMRAKERGAANRLSPKENTLEVERRFARNRATAPLRPSRLRMACLAVSRLRHAIECIKHLNSAAMSPIDATMKDRIASN